MRILTWNLNSRIKVISGQIEFVRRMDVDVVTLQEINEGSRVMLAKGLTNIGLASVLDTVLDNGTGQRKYGVLIASRLPLSQLPVTHPPEWSERLLATRVGVDLPFTLLTTYVPPGTGKDGSQKVKTLESAFLEATLYAKQGPTVLTGDLNAPREEGEHGLFTWAQAQGKDGTWRLQPSRGKRWDDAERAFFASPDIRDAHRLVNGWEPACSWVAKRSGKRWERRFDHVFVSRHWNVNRLKYEHQVISQGLSDHAAVVADIEFA